MGVLDRGDKADSLLLKEGEGVFEDGNVEVHRPRLEDDILPCINRCVPEVHEHVRIAASNGIERKVAGAVTGIAADDYFESCVFEAGHDLRHLPFEPLGKLEGDLMCPAFFEFFDQVRCAAQPHAPGR